MGKKKRNKYTTDGRVDMSKGGRVSKQVGGLPSAPSREQIEKFVRDQNIIDERNISRNVPMMEGRMMQQMQNMQTT